MSLYDSPATLKHAWKSEVLLLLHVSRPKHTVILARFGIFTAVLLKIYVLTTGHQSLYQGSVFVQSVVHCFQCLSVKRRVLKTCYI